MSLKQIRESDSQPEQEVWSGTLAPRRTGKSGAVDPSKPSPRIPPELVLRCLEHVANLPKSKALLARCMKDMGRAFFSPVARIMYRWLDMPQRPRPPFEPFVQPGVLRKVKPHLVRFQLGSMLKYNETLTVPAPMLTYFCRHINYLAQNVHIPSRSTIILDFDYCEMQLDDRNRCPGYEHSKHLHRWKLAGFRLVYQDRPIIDGWRLRLYPILVRPVEEPKGSLLFKARPHQFSRTNCLSNPPISDGHRRRRLAAARELWKREIETMVSHYHQITIVFKTNGPCEAWSEYSCSHTGLRSRGELTLDPAWYGSFLDDLLLMGIHIWGELRIVNAGAVDVPMLGDWNRVENQRRVEGDYETRFHAHARSKNMDAKQEERQRAKIRFLSMREYFDEGDWRGQWRPEEIAPWYEQAESRRPVWGEDTHCEGCERAFFDDWFGEQPDVNGPNHFDLSQVPVQIVAPEKREPEEFEEWIDWDA